MNADKQYWISSGTYTFLTRIATVLFGFGTFFLLVRLLLPADYGSFSLFLTVTSLIEVARNGLIQNAQIKFTATATPEEYPKILKASLVLNIFLSVISMAMLFTAAPFLAAWWNSPNMELMLKIYCINIAVLIPFTQFNFLQQANLDFKGVFYTTMLRQGLFFLVIISYWLAFRPFNLVELAWWQVVCSVMASLLSFYFVRKYWVRSAGIPWEWVSKLFHFGKYVFGTNLSAMIFQSIDQFMIGRFLGTAPAGLFNISMRITNLVDVPISTVVSVVFPQSSKFQGENQKQQMKDMFEKSTGFMLALILPACIVTLIFPELIIYIVAGPEYAHKGADLLRVTILSIMVQPFLRQFGTMLDSSGKPHVNFYALLGMATLNVVLNIVFIQQMGIMGAAYGTLTSMIVFAIVARIILGKNFDISFTSSIKYIFVFYGQGLDYLKKLVSSKYL